MNRVVFAFVTILCLLSVSSIVGLIHVVKADSGTITINADGSITPSSALITTVDNITYRFTTNIINESIVVERDNIMIDGQGYTVQGTGNGTRNGIGITLSGRSNVTIQDMKIKAFTWGIYLDSSDNATIAGNTISDSGVGINIFSSFNNTVSGNDLTNNLALGIWLSSSSNNNSISQNSVETSYDGIQFDFSHNNTVSGNNVTNNGNMGIELYYSSGNTLRRNVLEGNTYNLGVGGANISDFLNDVDVSNTVEGKPVYYLISVQDFAVPLDAGYVALVNSSSVTVENLNLTKNWAGIQLAYTTNTTIARNNMTNNSCGIYLCSSFNNTVSENNVANNSDVGIYLISSSNNTVCNNNFMNNTLQVYSLTTDYTNSWDNGGEGNYWSDYLTKYPGATEVDSSGIWNTPYRIDGNNTDNYPLMAPIVVIPEFPSSLVLSLFMIAALMAVIIYKRKPTKISEGP